MVDVERLVIPQDYYQVDPNKVVGGPDVALLKVERDIFKMNPYANETDQFPWVVPICLPPKLNFSLGAAETQMAKDIYEGFEDMDCHLISGNRTKTLLLTKLVTFRKGSTVSLYQGR